MISFEKQLSRTKKELGKPRFMNCIFDEISVTRRCFQVFMSLFGIAVSMILWYGFYCDRENYLQLVFAIFMSVSWFTLYDEYKSFVYKIFVFIGDKGIAVLKIKQRNKTVIKADHLFFKQIDKIIIDEERHYAVGAGGKWVEYIKIKKDMKTFLKINANHHSNQYETFKKTLLRYYQK